MIVDGLLGLRVFAAVAELKSFAAAAQKLDLSPAMTSKHVQHLEARVGARLLNRTSRSVRLTEAGALYLASVRPLIDGLDETEGQLRENAVIPRGALRVSLPVWFANPRFARLLAEFHARFPDVRLDFDFEGRLAHLLEEGYDLALRVVRVLEEGVIARKLADVPFHLVAAPALLERLGRPERIEDLDGKPLLAYAPIFQDGRFRVGLGLQAYDIQFRTVLNSVNESMLMLAARAGMGFAFMPNPMIEDAIADGRLERVLAPQLPLTGPLYAIYPDRSFLPAKVRTFLDFLVASDWLG